MPIASKGGPGGQQFKVAGLHFFVKYILISSNNAKLSALGCLLGSALIVLSAENSDVYIIGLPIAVFMAVMLILLSLEKTRSAALIIFNIVVALSAAILLLLAMFLLL